MSAEDVGGCRDHTVQFSPDRPAIVVTTVNAPIYLADDDADAAGFVMDSLTAVERRVIAARLRAWADICDSVDSTP